MYGYKIKKDNDNHWYFLLYPGNKPYQEIGKSKKYTQKEECEKALNEFRDFVNDNNLNSFNDDFMQLYKIDNKYSVQYIKNDNVIFSTRPYRSKQNRNTGINSIYVNITEYTTQIYVSDK